MKTGNGEKGENIKSRRGTLQEKQNTKTSIKKRGEGGVKKGALEGKRKKKKRSKGEEERKKRKTICHSKQILIGGRVWFQSRL